MVQTAPTINLVTTTNITIKEAQDLQREVDLTERAIRAAAGRGRFSTVYNATTIGNPAQDPMVTEGLTAVQTDYRDTFIDAGYLVSLDAATGLWWLSWEEVGVENVVSVYSIRTTVTPGAILVPTITAIQQFFEAQLPVATAHVSFANYDGGGDANESEFGAVNSVFYEYVAIVRQQDRGIDYSTNLRTTLVGTSLGYTLVPSNIFVYKLV